MMAATHTQQEAERVPCGPIALRLLRIHLDRLG